MKALSARLECLDSQCTSVTGKRTCLIGSVLSVKEFGMYCSDWCGKNTQKVCVIL